MVTQNKRLLLILVSTGFLLLIPFVAMQFTAEVNWTLSDFVIMGTLLLSVGLIGELIWRKVKKYEYKLLLGISLLLIFLLIWAELAVGIFGTPFAGS